MKKKASVNQREMTILRLFECCSIVLNIPCMNNAFRKFYYEIALWHCLFPPAMFTYANFTHQNVWKPRKIKTVENRNLFLAGTKFMGLFKFFPWMPSDCWAMKESFWNGNFARLIWWTFHSLEKKFSFSFFVLKRLNA